MNKTRIAAFLLAAATLIPMAMTSCGGDDPEKKPDETDNKTTTEAVSDTEPADALDARKNVEDGLGEYDFKEYVFRVMTDKEDNWKSAEDTSDIVDEAIYKRNLAVSERFNCNFEVIAGDYTTVSNNVTRWVNAGEDAFDLVSAHAVQMGLITTSDLFMNWYDIPNIDFSKPWWSDSTVDDLTYKGVCVTAIGDAALSAVSNAYCVFYNKVLGANEDLPNMYDVVAEGKWTYDYMVSITKDIYNDLNLNSEKDNDDLYGFVSTAYSNIDAYLWAFDNPVFKKDGDTLEFVYKTERVGEIITKLLDTINVYDGMYIDMKYADFHGYSDYMFAKGSAVFANGFIEKSLSSFRDLEDDYAILPYPKWDEAQEEYYSLVDGGHEVMSVPLTATELERIGTITEALCAESYKTLMPAYYDKALKVKGTRDAESIEIMDMLVNNRIFDFGYIYDGWLGCSFFLEWMFRAGNDNFESYYESKAKAVEKHYADVVEYFENYDH